MGVNYTHIFFLFTSGYTIRDSSPLACVLHLVFIALKELDAYWFSVRLQI